MIDFISELFSSCNFNSIEIKDNLLFQKSGKKTYWLVVNESNLDSLTNNQSELFEDCKSAVTDPALEKNISMLVLWKTEGDLELATLKQKIMMVEEDPYFFKKYVLYYSDEELTSLKEAVGDSPLSSFLNENIKSQSVFTKYKGDPLSHEFEPLIYRISMKVPFIDIDIGLSDGLDSLWESNKSKIQSNNDLLNLENGLFGIEIDADNTDPEEYLEALKALLPESDNGN